VREPLHPNPQTGANGRGKIQVSPLPIRHRIEEINKPCVHTKERQDSRASGGGPLQTERRQSNPGGLESFNRAGAVGSRRSGFLGNAETGDDESAGVGEDGAGRTENGSRSSNPDSDHVERRVRNLADDPPRRR